jgi:hypothetical protein
LKTHFSNPEYAELRDAVKRMVEGYDAADPDRASTFAFRDEWMARGPRRDGRVAGGYGALIKFLVSECRRQGAKIHPFSVVTAIEENRGRIAAYCDDGHHLRSRCGNSYRLAAFVAATGMSALCQKRTLAEIRSGCTFVPALAVRFVRKLDHAGVLRRASPAKAPPFRPATPMRIGDADCI